MLGLDHVVFPIRDAGASLAFYQDVLGLTLTEAHEGDDWGSYPWLMMIFALPNGGEIVLVELRDAPSPDYGDLPGDARHYAMATAAVADLASWRTRLRAAEVRFWEEDHGAQQSIYFRRSRRRDPGDHRSAQPAEPWPGGTRRRGRAPLAGRASLTGRPSRVKGGP